VRVERLPWSVDIGALLAVLLLMPFSKDIALVVVLVLELLLELLLEPLPELPGLVLAAEKLLRPPRGRFACASFAVLLCSTVRLSLSFAVRLL
jgi:hypothetical protein